MAVELDKLFDAKAASLIGNFMIDGGSCGFRIPIYQRWYTWDKSHIERIFLDVCSGIESLLSGGSDKQGYRFLGTIILVDEGRSKEPNFDCHSLEIVDGQQRLTTLALLASRVADAVRVRSLSVNVDGPVSRWLESETRNVQSRILRALAYKDEFSDGLYALVPRMVREGQDLRSVKAESAKYESLLGSYLHKFVHFSYANRASKEVFPVEVRRRGDEAKYFVERLKLIEGHLLALLDPDRAEFRWQSTSLHGLLNKHEVRHLFQTFPTDQEEVKSLLAEVSRGSWDLHLALTKLLIFANFLTSRVVLTRVVVQEQEYAYDIFEALNTSGEPLTALETFKPVLVKSIGDSWIGSDIEKQFQDVEQWVNSASTNRAQKKRSNELVIDTRIYIEGLKLSRHLREQRDFLRSALQAAGPSEGAHRLVQAFEDIKNFRCAFWGTRPILNSLNDPALDRDRDDVSTILALFRETKTTLSIPILSRYWADAQQFGTWEEFAQAIKALGAFLVLRRSVTSNTANIDNDFRELMERGPKGGDDPLCVGLAQIRARPLSAKTLKKYLRTYLAQSRIGVVDKDSWQSQFINNPIYQATRQVAKFCLLAASHNSIPQRGRPHLLAKGKPNTRPMVNVQAWDSDIYSSVEHVAPQTPREPAAWDEEIYDAPHKVHTIGNLTLVPTVENAELSNANWARKRLFFEAFSSDDPDSIDEIARKAKKAGVGFGPKTLGLLKEGAFNPLSAPLANVDLFNYTVLLERSENIAGLVWSEIGSWLDF